MDQAVKKARKRGSGDATGRGPVREKIGDLMNQGSNGLHPSADNLKELMGQGRAGHHEGALRKLGQIMEQK